LALESYRFDVAPYFQTKGQLHASTLVVLAINSSVMSYNEIGVAKCLIQNEFSPKHLIRLKRNLHNN
jgi:hypothetical protein